MGSVSENLGGPQGCDQRRVTGSVRVGAWVLFILILTPGYVYSCFFFFNLFVFMI